MFQLAQIKSVLFGVLGLAGAVSAQLGMTEEWQCGNINLDANGKIINDMDSWLTDHVVNDRFPPNEYLTGFVVPTIAEPDVVWAQRNCTPLGWANWSPACTEHDACMDAKGTKGVSSDQCNKNILNGWQSTCESAYALSWDEADLVYGRTPTSWGQTDKWARIGTKIACAQICDHMADLSQKVMLLGMSRTFPALPYTPPVVVPKPIPIPTPTSVLAFTTRVLGVGAGYEGSGLRRAWDGTNLRHEVQFDANLTNTSLTLDPDEDMILSSQWVSGNFLLETQVPKNSEFYFDGRSQACGLIVRNGFGKNSRFLKVSTNPDATEISVRYRTVDNGPVLESKITLASTSPKTLRIMKIGNNIVPFYMSESSQWIRLQGALIPWDASISAGLFASLSGRVLSLYVDGAPLRDYLSIAGVGMFSNPTIKQYNPVMPSVFALLLN